MDSQSMSDYREEEESLQNKWMDINTAPKDRRILLYYPDPTNAPNIVIGYAGEHNGHRAVTHTHWMELPQPPEQ